VRLQIGDGHSGFGLYVSSAEYPEEGSELLCAIDQQPAAVPHSAAAAPELGDRFMEILRAIHGDIPDAFADSARLAFVHACKESAAAADPMDTPLPCDVKVGNGTHRKGTTLRALVARMKMLHEAAFGPEPTQEQKDANLARLQGHATPPAAPEPMDMALCEAQSLNLREGQLYRFWKTGDCEKCAAASAASLEAYGLAPARGQPAAPEPLSERVAQLEAALKALHAAVVRADVMRTPLSIEHFAMVQARQALAGTQERT